MLVADLVGYKGVCCVADAHFLDKYNFPISDLPDKLMACLFSYCVKNKYLLVLNGDTSEKRTLSAQLSKFLAKWFRKFNKEGIAILVNCGNHEIIDVSGNTFLSQYGILTKNVYVFDKPGRIVVGDHALDVVPFQPLRYLRETLHYLEPMKDKTSLLFGHFPIKGAYFVGKKSDNGVTQEEIKILERKYSRIFVGDFHRRQMVTKKTHYTGIPFRLSFEDENFSAGFDSYNFDTKELEFERFACPDFKTFIITDVGDVAHKKSEVEGNIIKIQLQGTPKSVRSLNIEDITKHFQQSKPLLIVTPPPILRREIHAKVNLTSSMSGDEVIDKYVKEKCPEHLNKEDVITKFKDLYTKAKMLS